MASVGEDIVEAIADALNAPAGKPCTTWRTRVEALSEEHELPAFIVYAVNEQVETASRDVAKRTRTVRLECLVAGEAPADALIDPLYVFAVKTLFADAALWAQIRGLAESQIKWDTESGYQDLAIAQVDFDVVFATKRTDPTVKIF